MALTEDQVASIDALLKDQPAEASIVTEFRQRFPSYSLTRCDASDMDSEAPFRRYAKFDLYLVDRSDHCWRLTSNPARATGIVLAQRKASP